MSDAEHPDTETDHEHEMPKAYAAETIEREWYARWEKAGIFKADASATNDEGKTPYVVMMPPPNVTGTLHNGHALFVTLQDILIRYHRMRGDNALWLPGVDHAGIATQTVVERELKTHEGKSRFDLGREAFLERVWAWKEKNGDRIVEQMKTLGASADWSRMRFTMDDQCSKAVREAFVKMWNDDLIYRGERLVNWDPGSRTALSNEEVDHEDRKGELWRFAYKVKQGYTPGNNNAPDAEEDPGHAEIVVATTRPETMLGDVAVAVHPDDDRYKDLVGQELVHPFFEDRKVVVIADSYVDQEFGTGAVKITPAHDPNDFEMGERHDLEMINIFNLDATVNENGGEFATLDRFDARKQVKAKLEEMGLFRGTESIQHSVSISSRSNEVVEPMLSRQYFVKTKGMAEKACAAVDNGDVRILPTAWESTWNHFMRNIRDWCISRQLWWGHRIPVFYDMNRMDEAIETDANRKGGNTEATRAQADGVIGRDLLQIALQSLDDDLVRHFSVASTEDLAEQDPKRYVQEEDVLDTWFSSGLWPFSTLGWPEETDDLRAFYPGAVLETGFDILFFWVARMMMMGCYFMDAPPFKDIYLHAMVRDSRGKKMSKSLGNAIDPLDVTGGISLEALLEKTKTYPVPQKLMPGVLKWLSQEFKETDGIPASGADGLRFSLAALSGQGRDVKLAVPRVAGYRAFLNKIWNATRFVMMRAAEGPLSPLEDVKQDLSLGDRWILARLQQATTKMSDAIDNYRFDDAANTLYQFFWTEFCDWYIELSKNALDEEQGHPAREAARATLVHVLDTSMRLLHPLCPFQSEEIWNRLPGRQDRWPEEMFCATAPWPTHDEALDDKEATRDIGYVMDAISLARNARQESGISPQQRVPVIAITDDDNARQVLLALEKQMNRLGLFESLKVAKRGEVEIPRLSASNAKGALEIVVPLEGLIDVEAEKKRLAKERQKTEKEHTGIEKRISNPKFRDKAPPEVVTEAEGQLKDLAYKLSRIDAALERLNG